MRTDDMLGSSPPSRSRRRGAFRHGASLTISGLLAFATSCSPLAYHTRADRETYTALFQKSMDVDNVDPDDLELVTPDPPDLSSLHTEKRSFEFLGRHSGDEIGAKVLSLSEALDKGIHHSREYRNSKENLYLAGLDLTLARHRLSPIGYAGGSATRANDSRNAQLEAGMTKLVSTNTFARNHSAGFSWLYKTGARLSTDFTQDFLRIMSGSRSINDSDLAVSLVQPLLKGGGTTVTLEALTQEERNLLYDLRDFANYRRNFIVNIVTDYYGVLRARDRAHNSYVAYQGFVKNAEREEAFADEGKKTQNQLGRLHQAKLTAESRWIDAIRTYQNQLDQFKLTLGVPVDSKLRLDERELDRLRIEDIPLSRDEAVKIALVTRPDLITASDIVEDSERKIKVAKNGLLPGLDISVDYNAVSDPRSSSPGIEWNRRRWSTSLDLDLPIDRKAQRNIYRAAILSHERAKRAQELAIDRVKLQIFDAWRNFEQERLDFEIAEKGVALAARRLEEQILLSELGRGDPRDLVDAQEDLVSAQNQRTSTLINHSLARLRLWRDMGILYIDSKGGWVEKLEREQP